MSSSRHLQTNESPLLLLLQLHWLNNPASIDPRQTTILSKEKFAQHNQCTIKCISHFISCIVQYIKSTHTRIHTGGPLPVIYMPFPLTDLTARLNEFDGNLPATPTSFGSVLTLVAVDSMYSRTGIPVEYLHRKRLHVCTHFSERDHLSI